MSTGGVMSSKCCSLGSESAGSEGRLEVESVEKACCDEGSSLVSIGQVYVEPFGSWIVVALFLIRTLKF